MRFYGLKTFFLEITEKVGEISGLPDLRPYFHFYFWKSPQDSPKLVNHQENGGKFRKPI